MRVIEMRRELDKYSDSAEILVVIDDSIYPCKVERLGTGKETMKPDDIALVVSYKDNPLN